MSSRAPGSGEREGARAPARRVVPVAAAVMLIVSTLVFNLSANGGGASTDEARGYPTPPTLHDARAVALRPLVYALAGQRTEAGGTAVRTHRSAVPGGVARLRAVVMVVDARLQADQSRFGAAVHSWLSATSPSAMTPVAVLVALRAEGRDLEALHRTTLRQRGSSTTRSLVLRALEHEITALTRISQTFSAAVPARVSALARSARQELDRALSAGARARRALACPPMRCRALH